MLQVLINIQNVSINDIIKYNAYIGKKVYVIDVYRSPIERKMSEFFEKIADMHFNTTEENLNNYNVNKIINRFNKLFPYLANDADYFKEKYNLELPENFDFEKKYLLQEKDNITYVKLRLRDSSEWDRILEEIFDVNVVIISDYKTDNKPINRLYSQFKNDYILRCTDKDVNEEWLSFLDFRDFDAYKKDVTAFKPDYLFHLGAYTDLEYCEKNVEDTYLTNTISVENAVYIANELNIPLLYISTAGIFDGNKDLYDDWDQPNPLGVYARSKFMGERYVVENAKRFLVCRAGWMMGAGPNKDKKFIQKLMKQIKDGKKELFIVDDKDGTPTFTHDFSKNVKALIEKEYWGLYNMVCGGQTSRLEVAHELLTLLGLSDEIKINVVNSDFFKEIYFAERPPCERLDNRKLKLRNINLMQDWKVALKEYIDLNYTAYLK
jgi:dTDP-4-dehydrorhamnose reductase